MTVTRDRITGRRFGLLADTHDDAVDWPGAVERIRAAWGEVDAIIHCGDLTSPNAIATLSAIAPVFATRNPGTDPPASPPVLVDGPRVLEIGSSGIGVLFSLTGEPVRAETDPVLRFSGLPPERAMQVLFGGRVDVCVWGGTHAARVTSAAGTLFVNPGSPTLARTRTVGVLTIEDGAASVEILPV
ncbi:MAG: metallophosphoesterase family protein [Alphaproteobacteria bacterium]|nr:metallophosphoesterase family protein [Alphaproteobacteria bacterium]